MKRIVLTGLFAACACVGLQAQVMTANIPFGFQVGTKAMPAGNYQIYESSRLLTLRSSGQIRTGVVTLTLPQERKSSATNGQLVFNRYGENYFLKTMWTPNSNAGFALPQSVKEKELISRSQSFQTAGVPLRRQ